MVGCKVIRTNRNGYAIVLEINHKDRTTECFNICKRPQGRKTASRILTHVRESCCLTYWLLGGVGPIQEGNNIKIHNLTIISIHIEDLCI